MDREQAKTILSAWRPGVDDPAGHAALEEALALMESDPELAEWFAAQQEEDAAIRAELRAIEPPPGLRDAILAQAKTIDFPAERPAAPSLLARWAAIAACAVLAGLGLYVSQLPQQIDPRYLAAELPRLDKKHAHSFESRTGDLEAIRSWLAAHGGPSDFQIPAGLVGRGAIGCEVASVEGAKISILCFPIAGGEPVHLYVVARDRLTTPPPEGAPVIATRNSAVLASWSSGELSYFLSGRDSAEELQRFL
ncbi:MAG: hypothetical protein BGO12_20245 [Verrucomicrobia bacterium 61-8]|nr:hypothetical protein [Verrucomicrobiota bacterium]OJV03697.1 MAG: hypothetical protein BGO12_20245 [Verrucomicrobia bacterium 61-8]